jgi:cytidylate kinase
MAGCVIAIDGPAASGKSTVARGVAKALGFLFVSSGYFYRALAWGSIRDHLSLLTSSGILDHWITGRHLEFQNLPDDTRLFLDGDDASPHLSDPEVTLRVSQIAALPSIRNFVNSSLRSLSASHDLVMEGRDIGSVVFPQTPYKFYLDASPEERARRRAREGLVDTVAERDRLDSTRATAPLTIPQGAIVIDTTHLSLEEVVKSVLHRVNESLS